MEEQQVLPHKIETELKFEITNDGLQELHGNKMLYWTIKKTD